ncbi:hypothetical protein ACLB2K_044484 [Fragaria x ananassa]
MGKQSNTAASPGIKRGQWTPEEDEKLFSFVQKHGHGSWRSLPRKAGLQRCGKSCRLRWKNYLNPDIKRGNFSLQEDQTIIQLHALLGNRWSAIAAQLPKRTDNEVKNYWNTHLKKRLAKKGFDPVTHKPKTAILASAKGGDPKNLSNLSHIAQWETARLQAEASAIQVGQEIDSFGNVDVEGLLSNYDQFMAPTTSTSVLDFSEVFGDYGTHNEYGELLEALILQHNHNSAGFEVGDARSLEQYMWSAIAAQLPKRTDNEVKNYWNTHLKKRLAKKGFDPVTHKPKTAILASAKGGDPKNLSNLSHIAQWETARLQAEASAIQVGQEIDSFGNVDVEGLLSNYDQFMAPTTSTSVLDFSEVFGDYGTHNEYGELLEALILQHNHNSAGFEVGDARSLEQYM